MADLVMHDVPDDGPAALDARALRVGLSRHQYLQRLLAREATPLATTVTRGHLRGFATAFADLADARVMSRAWR